MKTSARQQSTDDPAPAEGRWHRRSGKRRSLIVMFSCAIALVLIGGGYVVLRWRSTGVGDQAAAADGAARHNNGSGSPSGQASSSSPSASASASATPSKAGGGTPASTTGFPGAGNTGVPAGVSLAAYTGSCTIKTANTVIDAKSLKCSVNVQAKNVTISRSKVVGDVFTSGSGSVTIRDTEVDRGTAFEAAVSGHNITMLRTNVHGGETAVNCSGNCTARESWLHGEYIPPGGNWHLDAFLTNGGSNMTLVHNTLACEAVNTATGGCSADVGIFGDFAPNSHITLDHNLFVASLYLSYCAYGGSQVNKTYQADHIVVTNNTFQHGSNGDCGKYGPIAHYDASRPGNVWSGNIWNDGTPVRPSSS